MKLRIAVFVLVMLFATLTTSFATTVSPGGSGSVGILTDLGSFSAGTYLLTGSGTVDLVGNGSFTMNPDGLPTTGVTHPSYLYFNPNGSYIADGAFGPAGTNAKIGALIGTLSATPVGSNDSVNDWFLIGYSTLVTLPVAGHIYASVNDTFHDNDTGAFDVAVSPAAAPEPATFALAILGLAGLGFVSLRFR